MFDNDIAPRISLLELIEKGSSEIWVIGQVYGVKQRDSLALGAITRAMGAVSFSKWLFWLAGADAGSRAFGGASGPWFRWMPNKMNYFPPALVKTMPFLIFAARTGSSSGPASWLPFICTRRT